MKKNLIMSDLSGMMINKEKILIMFIFCININGCSTYTAINNANKSIAASNYSLLDMFNYSYIEIINELAENQGSRIHSDCSMMSRDVKNGISVLAASKEGRIEIDDITLRKKTKHLLSIMRKIGCSRNDIDSISELWNKYPTVSQVKLGIWKGIQ